ncbi:MAG: Rieske (2Fe-2S) protein [Egibacteraceae bacterium]
MSETSAQLVSVARVEDVPAGTVTTVEACGRWIALVNYGGWFFAADNDCTHAGGPLGEGRIGTGCLLECPWHRAVFEVRSGRVRRGPARKPLRTYRVVVEHGAVFVAVP